MGLFSISKHSHVALWAWEFDIVICDCVALPHSRLKHTTNPGLAVEPTFNMVQLLVSLMQWKEVGFKKGTVYGHNTLKGNHVCVPASLHIKTCCGSLP